MAGPGTEKRAEQKICTAIIGIVAALKEDLEKQEEHFPACTNKNAFLAGWRHSVLPGQKTSSHMFCVDFLIEKWPLIMTRFALEFPIYWLSLCQALSNPAMFLKPCIAQIQTTKSPFASVCRHKIPLNLQTLAKTLKEIIGS